MQLDLLTSKMSQSRAWLARLPASKSLLLGLDAFPLPAADVSPRVQGPQRAQRHSSASAAAFSKALLSKDIGRPRIQAQATALELDEIEILAGPEEAAAESEPRSQNRGPFDQLGCDDRVTVSLHDLLFPHRSCLSRAPVMPFGAENALHVILIPKAQQHFAQACACMAHAS